MNLWKIWFRSYDGEPGYIHSTIERADSYHEAFWNWASTADETMVFIDAELLTES